jgi:hypothetical protein
MVLIGVVGLLMKRWFAGYLGVLAQSYLGNLSISFAVYFLVAIAAENRLNRLIIGGIALLVVEMFELTDGFKVMTNVYDPWDYAVNALGVALAYLVDIGSTRFIGANSETPGSAKAA